MSTHWQGTFTALVTPFGADGCIDEGALATLVRRQVKAGVDGIVPVGTTGESATLSDADKLRVIDSTKKHSEGRALVMAGAGGNATSAVKVFARDAQTCGADAILSVVPYYNRPSQEGLYRHFASVAESVDIPVFLYNVPGRTGASIEPSTVIRLAAHGNVRGIKEASGDLGRVMQILEERPHGFRVLSGEDHLTLPILSLGGDGVVSVVSNEVPELMTELVREGLAGRFEAARALHYRLLDLMRVNFIDTNPVPVKAALALMGLIEEQYRLPLTPVTESARQRIAEVLTAMDLVETAVVGSA